SCRAETRRATRASPRRLSSASLSARARRTFTRFGARRGTPARPRPAASGTRRGADQRGIAVQPDAGALAHLGVEPPGARRVVTEEDALELLALASGKVAARADEHLVASRVDERGDLGDALVLALAVGGLGRVLHVEPQRRQRLHDLEVVLGAHQIFPQPED